MTKMMNMKVTTKGKVDGKLMFESDKGVARKTPPTGLYGNTIHHYIPPSAAPMQQKPIPDTGRMLADYPSKRKCAWFPRCKSLASECNGYKKEYCTNAITNAFKKPETCTETRSLEQEQERIRKRERAAKAREKRKKQKEE